MALAVPPSRDMLLSFPPMSLDAFAPVRELLDLVSHDARFSDMHPILVGSVGLLSRNSRALRQSFTGALVLAF